MSHLRPTKHTNLQYSILNISANILKILKENMSWNFIMRIFMELSIAKNMTLRLKKTKKQEGYIIALILQENKLKLWRIRDNGQNENGVSGYDY